MIDLTPEARQRFEDYLRRMRGVLRGSRSVEPEEVEQNVIEHVELALAGVAAPVGAETLGDVLQRLGPPERWLPEEERPAWWRVAGRLYNGPEDWRLAYLTFGLTVLSVLLLPAAGIGIVFLMAAFLVARASVELSGDVLGARRWLVLPPIVVCFAILTIAALFTPIALTSIYLLAEGGLYDVFGISFEHFVVQKQVRVGAGVVAMAAAAWWTILSMLLILLTPPLRALFQPVTAGLKRRHALVLMLMAAVAAGLGSLLLFIRGV